MVNPLIKSKTEKDIYSKLRSFDEKIKNSFKFIRKDVADLEVTVEAIKSIVKSREKKEEYSRKKDNRLREEFRKKIDNFNEKITDLKLALSEFDVIKGEVVLLRDLAKIEEEIKISFKRDIDKYKEKVTNQKEYILGLEKRLEALEKGFVYKEKRTWKDFLKKKEKSEE